MKHLWLGVAMPSFLALSVILSACQDAPNAVGSDQTIGLRHKSADSPKVSGGVKISPDSAPHTYRMIVVKPAQIKESCTMTAVGPRVLLTAAHCIFAINPSRTVTEINLGKINRVITCHSIPQYQTVRLGSQGWEIDFSAAIDKSADVALCRVDTADAAGRYLPSGAPYEWIDTSREDQWIGKEVVIAGYGPKSEIAASSADELSAGLVKVDQSSSRPGIVRVSEEQAYADCGDPSSLTCAKHMLILSDDKEQLTGKDSGGAVFFAPGEGNNLSLIKRLPSARRIIAVNKARLDKSTKPRYSLVSALGNKRFRDWAVAWATSQGQPGAPLKICGVNTQEVDQQCNRPTFGGIAQ